MMIASEIVQLFEELTQSDIQFCMEFVLNMIMRRLKEKRFSYIMLIEFEVDFNVLLSGRQSFMGKT